MYKYRVYKSSIIQNILRAKYNNYKPKKYYRRNNKLFIKHVQYYFFLKNDDMLFDPDAAFFNALSLAVNFGVTI